MSISAKALFNDLKDPIKEIALIKKGLKTEVIEALLAQQNFLIKTTEILKRLDIKASTYFDKKKKHIPLDSYATEKFIRLISVLNMASEILGKEESQNWLYRNIPSLGNRAPLDLLDTETGHRLVEQALFQIKYGVYG